MGTRAVTERCNGLDPAYPGLRCYLDKGHENKLGSSGECEFTDARGEEWREIALNWMNRYYKEVHGADKGNRY